MSYNLAAGQSVVKPVMHINNVYASIERDQVAYA